MTSPNDVHVVPCGDVVEHDLDDDCVCWPKIERVDPDTGLPYPAGAALVVHHSLDGRECDCGR